MRKISILLLSIFFYFSAFAQGKFSSARDKPHGPASGISIEMDLPDIGIYAETKTGADARTKCRVPTAGTNPFDPHTGNVKRAIRDLEIWGGVGEEPLVWIRYGNSRRGAYDLKYGNGHNWNNSYNFTMTDNGVDAQGHALIQVHFPEGGQYNFYNIFSNNWDRTAGGIDKKLTQSGTTFFLQNGNGTIYRFQKFSTYYQLQDFRDKYQNLYTLTYDVDKDLTRVTEPAGRYLQINYTTINGLKVISQVISSDGRSVNYNYTVVVDGTTGVQLTSVSYGDGTQAIYTYHQYAPNAQPNLEHAIDPRYEGAAVNMMYTYLPSAIGFIQEERNGVTGAVMASLNASTEKREVCYGNGRKQFYNIPDSLTGEVNSYTDGLGNKTQYINSNGGTGYILSEIDALGRTTTNNTITYYGDPLEKTYPDGKKEKWTRDNLGLVLTHTDELMRVTTYTRDASHRVTRIDNPDGTFETFTYNGFGQVLDHRLRNGGVEHSAYNSRGLKTSFTDAPGNLTTYSYDAFDRLASVTNARGNITTYEYNERGLLTKMTNPDLTYQIYTYDDFGNRIGLTNELGKIWTTAYDEFRRPKTITDPLNRVTAYFYDLPGGICACTHTDDKPTKIIRPDGKTIEIEYDVEWHKIRETTGAGSADAASSFYEYDAVGNLVKMIDPKGKQWLTEYDVRDRIKSTTDPLGNKTEWTYDAAGNILTVKRPDNGTTTNVYDNMDRLKQSNNPKAQITKMTYDADGNMIKLTDPKNNEYNFEYDLLDRKTKMIYPGGAFEMFTYNAVSNLATYTNRGGNTRTYTYDNRNRETLSDWNDATPDVTKTYDAASRLVTMTSGVSALSYTYDDANESISETQAIAGSAGAKTVSYAYNADGLRNTLTYPGGTVISYTYTGRNQLSTVTADAAPSLATYTYDANGNRLNKTLKNGTTATYSYDDVKRMLGIDNKKAATSFSRFDYGYDNVNRRKYVQRDNDKGDVFSYDAIDQVIDVRYDVTNADDAPGTPLRTVTYALDAAGNRTSVTDNGTATDYTTNSLNQYTDVGGGALAYTVNGSLQNCKGWTYTYDAQNRLTKADDGVTTVDFLYDARNRCVKRVINGAAKYFYYDDWNLIEERNSSDAQVNRYVHGAMIDEMLIKTSPANTVYYHYDAIGDVIRLTDIAGNVVEKYAYDVFGTPTIKDGSGNIISASSFGNRFMFTGKEFIQEIGLYDYRNRVYSPESGRFLQADPIGFNAHDYNIYRYVRNNSINALDPFGLWEFELFAGAGIAAQIHFGYNSGQWNFGSRIGIGVGWSSSIDIFDTGCQQPGLTGNLGAVFSAGIPGSDLADVTGELNYHVNKESMGLSTSGGVSIWNLTGSVNSDFTINANSPEPVISVRPKFSEGLEKGALGTPLTFFLGFGTDYVF